MRASCSFRCPYHANVMKMLDTIKRMIVAIAFIFCSCNYCPIPAKPMNAIARIPATISATGTPRMARGTSASSSCVRMAANRASARANPPAVARAYTKEWSKPKFFCATIMATPSTAQFVVISGR